MSEFSQSAVPLDQWARLNRIVEVSDVCGAQDAIGTVFVGLYNASEFWGLIEGNIARQASEKWNLVVVDNCSSDLSWQLLASLKPSGYRKVTLVRNAVNLGGLGSLMSNLDLCEGDWIVTLHQDDLYYPNHLIELESQLLSCDPNVVAMCSTSMDRLSAKDLRISAFPRASWIGKFDGPEDIFLSNLRNHAIPFPAAAFSKRALLQVKVPWHDTSFPDTEMVLLWAHSWRFKISSVSTMAYRENPKSESHAITDVQRQRGQAQALLRVFNSTQFRELAERVPLENRCSFARHSRESLDLRFSDLNLRKLTVDSLYESLASAWSYSCPEVNLYLKKLFEEQGKGFSSEFLNFSRVDPSGRGRALNSSDALITEPRWSTSLVRSAFRFGLFLITKLGLLRKLRVDFDFDWRKR